MVNPGISEEFIGRFVVSYKDGDVVYAYDEITHGLYKFSLDYRKVSIVLFPENIHHSLPNKIMGISKSGNEIILIPEWLDQEWTFYEVKKENIRYDFPIKRKVRISSTITIGSYLFFIPSNTCNPIIIFSLVKMEMVKVYNGWYNRNKDECNNEFHFWIWGASFFNNLVVFPMIDSKYICCVNMEVANVIALDIPSSIRSVSIYMDRIWILPTTGKYIYTTDLKGNIIDRVNLFQIGNEILAQDFIRIVCAGENVFLIPTYGRNICIYQCREKQIVQMDRKGKFLEGRLFVDNLLPYWDIIIEDETLHMLPCDYRYNRVNIVSLKNEEYSFDYGKNIDFDKYWKMVNGVKKRCILEKRERDLKELFRYIQYSYRNHFIEENKAIGKKIWKFILLK